MVQTLFTNSKLTGHNFKHEFKTKLASSKKLIVASGYFGVSPIIEQQDGIINLCKRGECKILIGMIYHGGVTDQQKKVLVDLDAELRNINKNSGVFVSTKPYHGKIYLFDDTANSTQYLYLGSSNFSEEGFATRHESTALIQDEKTKNDTKEYLNHLFDPEISKPLNKVDLKLKKASSFVSLSTELLENYKIEPSEYPNKNATTEICEIELRVDSQPNSSLNLYFDKGRINKETGLYAPRPWYEIEITSTKQERQNPFYPRSTLVGSGTNSRNGEFIAYAEDNGLYYKFRMKVCSADGKAIFSSEESGGRETLGKFIKGKLERKGLLEEGQRITSDTLREYGRSCIRLIKITEDVYILEF